MSKIHAFPDGKVPPTRSTVQLYPSPAQKWKHPILVRRHAISGQAVLLEVFAASRES